MFTDAAYARLLPFVESYLATVGIPTTVLAEPAGVSLLLNHNPGTSGYWIDVVVMLDDGPRLLMQLDPVDRGLTVEVVDGTVVVDADSFEVV